MISAIENIMKSNSNILLLIGRLFVGLAMASHGYPKLMGMAKFSGYMGSLGVPFPELTAAVVMLVELVGGLLIAIGFKARLSAFGVAAVMLGAAFIAHGADPFAKKELALMYVASCIILMGTGPGRFSLDKS